MEVGSTEMRQPSKFKRICVFCGSSQGKKSSFQDAAIELGKELVTNLNTNSLLFLFFPSFFVSQNFLFNYPKVCAYNVNVDACFEIVEKQKQMEVEGGGGRGGGEDGGGGRGGGGGIGGGGGGEGWW